MGDADPATDAEAARASRVLGGGLRLTVLTLALPVLAEQFLSFLVGFVDTFLSGRISAEATSAIGVAAYVNWLVELMFSTVGFGTTALVARHWGAGDFATAHRISRCSMSLAIVAGLIVSGLMYAIAPAFSEFLGSRGETFDLSVRYLRLTSFGHLFTSVSLVGASALRGAGNMRLPMVILGLVSVLNVIFSSVLVFGVGPVPAYGVDGIAAGTVGARVVGGVLMLIMLGHSVADLGGRPSLGSLFDSESVRRILRIGLPGAADSFLMWGGHFLFLRLIAQLGDETSGPAIFAAHIVGMQVESVNYLPAWAWGTAAATLVGQSLGASLPDRARRGAHEATRQAVVLASLIGLAFFFGAAPIYHFMHEDEAVRLAGIPALQLLAFFEVPLAIVIVYAVSIRGSGTTIPPLIINFCGIFLVRLPLAWLLAVHWDYGLLGAWTGMCCDVVVRAVGMSWYFLRGKWSEKRI